MLKALGSLVIALTFTGALIAITDGTQATAGEPLAIFGGIFGGVFLFVFGSLQADLRELRLPPDAPPEAAFEEGDP